MGQVKTDNNQTVITLSEARNGIVISGYKLMYPDDILIRVCSSDNDLIEEIAKLLIELKLITHNDKTTNIG